MDFSDKEMRILLQALYRYRGEVSGASQSEQNKYALVASVIGKIEAKAGPLTAERTGFDREMDESLSVLLTGRIGASKAKPKGELDKADAAPKVKAKAKPKTATRTTTATKTKTATKAKSGKAPVGKAAAKKK